VRQVLLFFAAVAVVGMIAGTAGPALAAQPTPNGKNCVGVVLSGFTPENFHHGNEAERAVIQAEDGRGEEITSFTSVFAGCRGL
jgi:hypothetical protein